MQTREIPREEWASFFEQLSKSEADHPVRLEIAGTEIGSQEIGGSLKLIRIGLEQKGSGIGALGVAVDSGQGMLEHMIVRPEHLYVEEDDSGTLECIDIEDAAHVKTLIQFQPASSRS